MSAPLLNQSTKMLYDSELLDIIQDPSKGKPINVTPERARKEIEERLERLKILDEF